MSERTKRYRDLAEGHNGSGREFARFISIALGSPAELKTHGL